MDFDICIDIDTTRNCIYINKTDFNRNISMDNTNAFSIIHINARSFVHNHEKIENYYMN